MSLASRCTASLKMVTSKKYILQNKFSGSPKESDVKIIEEQLPPLKDGQYLCQSVYISVDPYQRAYYQQVGDTILGSQVARIIESKNPKYPVGKHIVSYYGWKTHEILDDLPADANKMNLPTMILPEGQPLSYYLGVLGMPGVTAYFGFLEICNPKAGETVVVTGAGGAVGSVVGQIAKIKGCKVIGVVGSDKKGKWLTNELGFDSYINYKNDNFSQALKEVAPKGVDCYFDNVGGEISSDIMKQMNTFGRISVCGAISAYNNMAEAKASIIQGSMVFHQLTMQGFIVSRYMDRWQQAVNQNTQWLKEGKLKVKETVTKGFENTFTAFADMMKGGNFGKAIVEL